jgi:hypothetical protein
MRNTMTLANAVTSILQMELIELARLWSIF